jgi:hypothetical protein
VADLCSIQVLTPELLQKGEFSTNMMISDVTWTDPFLLEANCHHLGSNNTVPLVSPTEAQIELTGSLATTPDLGTD